MSGHKTMTPSTGEEGRFCVRSQHETQGRVGVGKSLRRVWEKIRYKLVRER